MILITGGSGYLGGRLAKYLSESIQGKVILTIRERSDYLEENLPNCEFRTFDIAKNTDYQFLLKDITDVIHLISMNAHDSALDPLLAEKINAYGTYKLTKASAESQVKRFIYFSTAHIYGSPLVGKIDETTSAKATHPYGLTHLQAENYIQKALKETDTKYVILRLSNAVGAPLSKNVNCWMLVVNDIIKQLVTNHTMKFSSSKHIERDFIPISEISRIVFAILKDDSERYKGIYNLGSGASLSLENLAKIISERAKILLKINPKIQFPESNQDSNNSLIYSISKIKSHDLHISDDLTHEIDQLIIKSQDWFNFSGEVK